MCMQYNICRSKVEAYIMPARPPKSRSAAIRKDSTTPKHAQLRETLRAQIESLQPDQPIPSEHELCAQYDVSRITVRKALADLIHEGLLYTVQGKGTFVAARKFRIEWAHEMAGFHADMARRGLSVKVRILEQILVSADERVAAELNLNLGAPVVKLVRLRYVDDQPFDIATNFLPAQLFPGLEREDLRYAASVWGLLHARVSGAARLCCLETIARAQPPRAWRRVRWGQATKGPLAPRLAARRVHLRDGRGKR